MDTRLPLETGRDRLRQLYRLPLRGDEFDVLVIGTQADAQAAFDPQHPDLAVQVAEPGAALPTASCDAIALPGTLARLDGGASRPALAPGYLLCQARAAVRPGGVVMGHVDPCLTLHGLRRLMRSPLLLRSWPDLRSVASARRCRRTLEDAGFVNAEVYYVEPRIDEPMALIASDPAAARSHFVRAVRRSRGLHSAPGYALRLLLAELRLGGLLQPQLFYWARRPC